MTDEIVPATHGVGPLLQRDYWAVFCDCALRPSDVMGHVKAHFCSLPPATLVEFTILGDIAPDAEFDILIKPAQHCRVRVIHEDPLSITLATLAGHPEAGRITFGCYRNPAGELVFHIRSRARSATTLHLIGFLALGEAMQTNTWTDFITSAATVVGARIRDVIHADTQQVEPVADDDETLRRPTYVAVGD